MSEQLPDAQNSLSKVKFRESVLAVQNGLQAAMDSGKLESKLGECIITHYFTPIDENYGCCAYARKFFLPKGVLAIGKIHKHQHLNFIMQGSVYVSTEHGKKFYKAPEVFVSEIGLKRAVWGIEDTIWVTVHLTKHVGEENLDKIEEEIIAKSYDEIGLIDSVSRLVEAK